jgi:formylglycine-generating enzyme required for sulfatase activity
MVYVSGGDFFMASHEVTVEQYQEFMQRQSGSLRGLPLEDLRPGPTREEYMFERIPVQKISWRAAEAYCVFYGWQLPSERQYQLAILESGGLQALDVSAQEENTLAVVPVSKGLTGLLTNAPEYIRDTDGKAIGQYAVGDPRPLDFSTLTFDLPASRSDKRPYIGFRPVMGFPNHLVTEL